MAYKLLKEFYKLLEQKRQEKRCKMETAFIRWYIDTRFEETCEKHITDGPSDGGIDALVFDKQTIYVIQSEFCREIFDGRKSPSPLSVKKYAQFDGLVGLFKNRQDFDTFLTTVNHSLHNLYRRVANKIQSNPCDVVWEVTTLHGRSLAGERRLQNLDPANLHYASDNYRLYDLSLEGATPPAAPLELNFTEHFIVDDTDKSIKSYVAQVQVKDFVQYVDQDPQFRVLARNVRGDLRSEINKDIQQTYNKCPDEFWYSHNGITMICNRATIKGKKISLLGPNIINGAQTMYALKGVTRRHPKATVLVRIIELPAEEETTKKFINSIIFRTNQQNKMFTYDLRANDIIQVTFATEFGKHNIFYERRRGDWDLNKRIYRNQGFERLKATELAQVLMTCDNQIGGVSIAKKSKEDLFSEKYYGALFDATFREVFFKYSIYTFIKRSLHDIRQGKITTRERNHTLLTCVATAYNCLESSPNIRRWQERTLANPAKVNARNQYSKKLNRCIQKLFLECWKRWKAENKKDATLSPNNFFKSKRWNDKLIRSVCPKFRKQIQRSFGALLQ